MNPLNTFLKAKSWADERAKFFSKNGRNVYFIVCKWNDGFIVHEAKEVYKHIKEYTCDELVYCSNEDELKRITIMIRFNEKFKP